MDPVTRLAKVVLVFFAVTICRSQDDSGSFHPTIPKTWVDDEIASLEVPLANAAGSPKHVTAEYYYRIPVRSIYRTYPRYRPGKEPRGYLDWLRTREPEILFNPAALKTEADWIRAGELVFHYPIDLSPELPGADADVVTRSGDPFGKEDVSPFVQYVIRKKGVVELGTASCADCHTRIMPDGSLVAGAQGNRPVDRIIGIGMRVAWEKGGAQQRDQILAATRIMWKQELWTPWIRQGPQSEILQLPLLQMAAMHEAIPPGVLARQRSSVLCPPAIPDLIGIKDIRYLDRSGVMRHREIAALMRYAALNQGVDMLASYGGFIPLGKDFRELPDP